MYNCTLKQQTNTQDTAIDINSIPYNVNTYLIFTFVAYFYSTKSIRCKYVHCITC